VWSIDWMILAGGNWSAYFVHHKTHELSWDRKRFSASRCRGLNSWAVARLCIAPVVEWLFDVKVERIWKDVVLFWRGYRHSTSMKVLRKNTESSGRMALLSRFEPLGLLMSYHCACLLGYVFGYYVLLHFE